MKEEKIALELTVDEFTTMTAATMSLCILPSVDTSKENLEKLKVLNEKLLKTFKKFLTQGEGVGV